MGLVSHMAGALASFGLIAVVSAQTTVQRCESKDGRVTYSNTQCPAGTSPVRKVNTEPPVSTDDRKAAQDRAKKEGSEAKQIDKERAQDDERDKRKSEERLKADLKADAKAQERCERARRDLERAKNTRAELTDRSASTAERIEKAERDITRRESEVAKDCPR